MSKSKKLANPQFYYRGNDVVKLWEQYLKANKGNQGQAIKFFTTEATVDTMFHGLTQVKEIAIVLNEDDTLYKNKEGASLTLCVEVNYEDIDITQKMQASLEQLKEYNNSHEENKIIDHIIIFPYHAGPLHWNLGKIVLTMNKDIIQNLKVAVYEPFGGKSAAEDKILEQIVDTDHKQTLKIENAKQQNDYASCGVITAENGKEFLKRDEDGNNLLHKIYSPKAKEIRQNHIQEINLDAFLEAQLLDEIYEAKGDKKIDNQTEIIEYLESVINTNDFNWVKDVLPNILSDQDDILHDNFNLFKQFIVQLSVSDTYNLDKLQAILKNNLEFQEGAIDLIKELAENTQKLINPRHSQKSSSTVLLEEVAFFVLLSNPTKFFLLQKTLDNIKDGTQKYQNFMKRFNQSPKDKDSYKKSMDIIKSKLFDNLYKNFKDEIDYLFINKFVQEVKPYVERIQKKEITKNIECDLGFIAFQLIKRKEKEEPQIELLKKFLSDKVEELNLKVDFKIEKLKKHGHANDVYLISNTEINQDDPNTIDYYAKSFSQDEKIYAKNGLIDPNELFIYKILEYTGFGPECWFLMKNASSSYGTISRSNFILTRNLGKGEGINFLLDNEENKELFEQIFSKNKNFAIEISAAASINDIVALWDTFKNSGNYGVVFSNNSLEKLLINKDSDIKDYRFVFIDHLPNASNGILSQLYSYKLKIDERYNTTKYSPREYLIGSHRVKPNKFIELAKNSKEIGFSKDKIIKDVYQRLGNNKADDQQWDRFKAALKKAKEDVTTIITEYAINFYNSKENTAFDILEYYYNKILYSVEIFDEKYKENPDQYSYGSQCFNHGMSDKDISLNLQLLKYNIEADNRKASFFIEEKVLSQHNILDKIEFWPNLNNKRNDFLAIVTVINSENKKHAVLFHYNKTNGEIPKITLIDPLSKEASTFKSEIVNLAYLFHQKGKVVQIIYSGKQDKDSGACGDISLIMLQELIDIQSIKKL